LILNSRNVFDDDIGSLLLQLGQEVLVGARNHLHSHVVHVLDLLSILGVFVISV
jgi:hypothetical protein